MSSRIDSLKVQFQEMEEVKRIKELESYIDNNPKINELFLKLKTIQKQMVHAKEFNQYNQLKIYTEEYNKTKNDLMDLPFVEEYLELLEIVNNNLANITFQIENSLNTELNKK